MLVTSLLAWKEQMKGGRVDLTDSVMVAAHREKRGRHGGGKWSPVRWSL